MKKLLLILLLIPLCFSGCADIIDNFFNTAWAEASFYFGAVILFAVAIISIAYIYGTSANDAKATVFAKDELFHLFMSIMIIFGTIGIITAFCYIGSFFLNYTFDNLEINDLCYLKYKDSPTNMAICYSIQMEKDAAKMVEMTIDSSINEEMESTWIYTFNFPLMGTTSTPTQAYRKAYSTNYDMMNSMFATPALISITMQRIVLENSLKFSIVVLLPFAILLRVFFPTRQMGNILIALVIAIHIFLPFMYALNGAMYYNILTENDCTANYSSIVQDHLLGNCESPMSVIKFVRLLPQAIFLPNLTIAIMITLLSSVNKALRVIG